MVPIQNAGLALFVKLIRRSASDLSIAPDEYSSRVHIAPIGNPASAPIITAYVLLLLIPRIREIGRPSRYDMLSDNPESLVMDVSTINGNSDGIRPPPHIDRAFFTELTASCGERRMYPKRNSISSHKIYISYEILTAATDAVGFFFALVIIITFHFSYYFTDTGQ